MKIKQKPLLIGLLVVLTIAALIVGLTYAYFTANIRGNEEASTTNLKARQLVIDFETSEYIQNTSAELIAASDISSKADFSKFSVSNNSTGGTASYTLRLENIEISDNFKSADFKWRLEKNGSIISTGNFSNIGNKTSIDIGTADILAGSTDSYVFRIWLEETAVDQSQLYNGSFSGKIALEAKSLSSN